MADCYLLSLVLSLFESAYNAHKQLSMDEARSPWDQADMYDEPTN